ncbi:MAG: Ig-like domain-containing protein [Halobacteriota archaeon]|jgi:hypothetical protein
MKMNTKRTIAITLTLLMTASAVGTLSVSAATVAPTKPTALTIASTDQTPTVNEPISIFGRLMSGAAYVQGTTVQGTTVTLTYSTDGGSTWSPLGTCAMNYYGGYSYAVTPGQLPLLSSATEQDYLINASFPGSGAYMSSSNSTWVYVHPYDPHFSIQTSVQTPVTNQPFTISGQVTDWYNGRPDPSVPVTCYVYWYDAYGNTHQWEWQTTATTSGVYRFPGIQLPAGSGYIGVGTYGNFNTIEDGNYISFSVNTAPTQLSIASGTAHPAANKPFAVYGLLTNGVTGARLPNEPGITLSYSADGGITWNTLTDAYGTPIAVSTNGNGQYAFSTSSLPAGIPAGTYQIQVHFPGDQNYSPSDSPVLTIQVG